MSPLLTPAEVAALLSVSKRTVQRLLEAGELPGLKVGSQWRCRAESIQDWQARRETGSRAGASAPAALSVAPPAALPVGGDYEPVFAGEVPWRAGVIAASSAAARGRSTAGKKERRPRG